MARKYIKNCTGDDCGGGKASVGFVIPAFWSRVVFYILLIAFIASCGYVLFFANYLKINKIEIGGTQELNAQEIQQKIEKSLEGKYLNFVPKNNFLFIFPQRLENFLKNDYKKIRTAKVTKKFPDSIAITIDEHQSLLVWCSNQKCYLLDENGTAYNEADFTSPELTQNHLLQITDNSGKEVVLGEKVIEVDYEQYALGVKDTLMRAGYEIQEQYWTNSRMSEEINVKTSQDFEIYFSTQFPLETAVKNLTLIVKKEIPEDKRGQLAYIDLRNENKVFYKFKDAEPTDEQAAAQQTETSSPQPTAEDDKKGKDEKKK